MSVPDREKIPLRHPSLDKIAPPNDHRYPSLMAYQWVVIPGLVRILGPLIL